MTIAELTKRYTDLISSDKVDQTTALSLLKEITDDYTTAATNTTTLSNIQETLKTKDKEISDLKSANLQLFLSVGSSLNTTQTQGTSSTQSTNSTTENTTDPAESAIDAVLSALLKEE